MLAGGRASATVDEAVLQSAQRDAELALNALLSQLAGPAAGQLFAEMHPRSQPQPQERAPLSGINTADAPGGTGMSSRSWASTIPPPAQYVSHGKDTGGDTQAQAAAGEASAGPSGRGIGGGRAGGAAAAANLAVLALLASLLGPQLTAAVEATRRARCVAAVALAAVLYSGILDVGHLRGVPPLMVLLATQAALIAAARVLGASPTLPRVRSIKQLAGSLGTEEDGADDAPSQPGAAGDTKGTGAEGSALASPALGLLRGDWLAFVPGLRPLIDRVSSAAALVSGLYGDVALFLVSYIVLGACGQLAGGVGATPRP